MTTETKYASDEQTPRFMFACTHTDLLVMIVNGELDAVEMARRELENRGLDNTGKWVGWSK